MTDLESYLKNHSRFDKIIFLVTAPDRITLPDDSPLQVIKHVNYHHCKVWAEKTTGEQKQDYKLIVDYYEKIHNTKQSMLFYSLAINHIRELRPDCLLYPCFENKYVSGFPLFNITKFEDDSIGMNDKKRIEFYQNQLRDSRLCHMTGENNYIVAEMFESLIKNIPYSITEDILIIPKHSINYYYQSKFVEPFNYIKDNNLSLD